MANRFGGTNYKAGIYRVKYIPLRAQNYLKKRLKILYGYIDEILDILKFVRGRNKRLVQFVQLAIENVSNDLQDSIASALTYEFDYNEKGIISGIRLVVNKTAKAYEYAKYVEFGTGPVGSGKMFGDNTEHPFAERANWSYHGGSKRSDGGWVYFNQKLGKFLTTWGQTGMGFMYRAYMLIQQLVINNETNDKWYSVKFGVDKNKVPYVRVIKKQLVRKKRQLV
jgi:hypothetical protein